MATARPASTEVTHDRGAIEKTAPPIRQFDDALVVERVTAAVHRLLARHSITLLRVSVGVVALGFGILKYFPGVSPAENLVETTTQMLTFGLVPDKMAMVGVATLECVIGLSLIIGRGLRVTIYLLVLWILGILSPVVLLSERLFSGPNHAPTLEGQYVLKDVILFTASLVIATTLYRSKNSAGHQSTDTEGHWHAVCDLQKIPPSRHADRSRSDLIQPTGISDGVGMLFSEPSVLDAGGPSRPDAAKRTSPTPTE
ncbi:MAG: hypothetical protein ACRDTH_12675 [Pseudonocardiaceae bacterium]